MSAQVERPQVGADDLLTIPMAHEYAPAIPERFLRRLVQERRIPVVRIGRRVFLARRDLDALVSDGYSPPIVP